MELLSSLAGLLVYLATGEKKEVVTSSRGRPGVEAVILINN